MVGFIKIDRPDILQLCEMQDMNGFVLFGFCLFKIVICQRDIFVRLIFEPLDDVVRPDFFSAAGTYLFVFDTAAVLFAKLIKMNIVILRRGIKTNRDMDHSK